MSEILTGAIERGEGWGLGRPVNIQGTDFWSVSSYQLREFCQRIRIAPYYEGIGLQEYESDYREE